MVVRGAKERSLLFFAAGIYYILAVPISNSSILISYIAGRVFLPRNKR